MNFTDIKTWVVGPDKIARPKQLKDKFKFKSAEEDFKNQHHYAVDESLTPGEYDASVFDEPVWQYEPYPGVWHIANCSKQSIGKEYKTRQFLPLKQQYPSDFLDFVSIMETGKIQQEQPESLKFGEWVDVNDRLPEHTVDVLLTHENDLWVSIGYLFGGNAGGFYNINDADCECYPTHWQPLPSPAKLK